MDLVQHEPGSAERLAGRRLARMQTRHPSGMSSAARLRARSTATCSSSSAAAYRSPILTWKFSPFSMGLFLPFQS